jgi:hypothetical protein
VISAILWPEGSGLLPFLLVFVASVLVGWRRMRDTPGWSLAPINDSIKHGLLVAVLLMEIDLVIISVVAELTEPSIETSSSAPWWGAVGGALAFFLGFGIIAGAAGMIGGLLGALLAYAVHRWRHRGEPTAPAGMS